jgi:cytochrome c-type biogenesis protein CcmH/NrfG
METLKKAIAKWPEDPSMQLLMGRMALSQKDTVQAKAAFQKVLELDPTNGEAKTELQKL